MSRIAVYIDANHPQSAQMAVRAARLARERGDRVVTMVREATRPWCLNTGRRRTLKRLLERMAGGEFDAIVLAPTPDDALGELRLSFQAQLSKPGSEEVRV